MHGKIVPQSKLSEWKGLDRISLVVHDMGFVYREQEKDDLGIDGEIEICVPRPDGKGRISTGKIIKVQSKSGASFITQDNDSTFRAKVTDRDLRYWNQFDVPVIYIVYHPGDDRLYWRYVQGYIEDEPDVFDPPVTIAFEKARDRFDDSSYDRLFDLCNLAAERVSHDVGETLFTNVLPVEALPDTVWVTPVLPERRSRFHERIGGSTLRKPPYVFRSGTIITLTDPGDTENALREVVESGTSEPFALLDWVQQDEQNEDDLRALLRSAFHRHLRRLGMHFDKDDRKYYFNEDLTQEAPIRRSWMSLRTGRQQERLVAKYYEYGDKFPIRYFKHWALSFHFQRFGEQWGLMINPSLVFTKDGTQRVTGKGALKHLRQARAKQYNNIYMNDVLFWSHVLSAGDESFAVSIEGMEILRIKGRPTTVDAPFSVRTNEKAASE